MCPLFRLLIFNMFRNQNILVRWKDCLSAVFSIKNGVQQGAVLSPVLFIVYIDSLLQNPKSGVGCHTNGVVAGVFVYADDMI